LDIAQRKIRIKRGHISKKRQRRKAFPTTVKSLGDCIQIARVEMGISQLDLAKIMGVKKRVLSKWEADMEEPTEVQQRILFEYLNLGVTFVSGMPTFDGVGICTAERSTKCGRWVN